jgi:FMN phosphatase YigB (HAD superfamily)
MVKPKVVFIDWHNTLCDYKFFWHLEKSNSIKDVEMFHKITQHLFLENSNTCLIPDWMRGKYNSEQIFEDLSKRLNLKFDLLFEEFIKSCKGMKLMSPKVVTIINELKEKGIKFYIATDNMDSFERWVIPTLKLDHIFDGILNSYNLGVLKKDIGKNGESLFFKNILKEKSVHPSESILFDDSEDKGNKLKKYGINYIRINEKNNLEANLLKLSCECNNNRPDCH